MMKKFIAASVVAALVGVSSSCFAGFGLPKIGGFSAPKASSQTSSTEASVDTSDIISKQANILKYMRGASYAQSRAYEVVFEAFSMSDRELAQVNAALKESNNAGVKKARAIIKKKQQDLIKQAEAVAKNEEQVAKLAKAIKTGKVYQQAAIVNYAFVAANAPGALSEASSAVKNVGKNPTALGKINGAIATFKLGIDCAGQAQNASAEYDKVVDVLKNQFGVDDAALANAQAADVQAIAAECLDFVGE